MKIERTIVVHNEMPDPPPEYDLSSLPDQQEYDVSALPDQTFPATLKAEEQFGQPPAMPEYEADFMEAAKPKPWKLAPLDQTKFEAPAEGDFGAYGESLSSTFDAIQRVYGKMPPGKPENIWAMAQEFDKPISFVIDNYDELNKLATDRGTDQLMNIVALTAGVSVPPILAAKGLGVAVPWSKIILNNLKIIAGMEALTIGGGLARSPFTGKYKPMYLSDLLPETADTMTRTIVELADMGLKAKAAHKGLGMLEHLWDRAMTETIVSYIGGQKVYVDPGFVSRVLREKGVGLESDFWKEIGGISPEMIREAKDAGYQIELPVWKYVSKADRPIVKQVKEAFGVSPYVEKTVVTKETEGKATPVGGLLEAPEKTKVVAGTTYKWDEGTKIWKIQEAPGEAVTVPQKIEAKAKEIGVDPDTAVAVAAVESGFSPTIKNPKSSATGIFQVIDSTWKGLGGTVEDRFEVDRQIALGVDYLYQNTQALTKAFGRKPEAWEVYVAHQQGAGGAVKLFTNPDSKAVDLVGEKAVVLNGGTADMTAREFTTLWQKKFNAKLAKVQGGAVPKFTRENFIEAVDKNLKIPQEQKDASIAVIDAMADSWAETYKREPAEFWTTAFAGVQSGKAKDFVKGMLGQSGPGITETPEFKNFIKDSTVKTLVYHGTTEDFSTFSKGDIGFHVGTSEQASARATDLTFFDNRPLKGKAARVMPLYISLKNPLRLPDVTNWDFPVWINDELLKLGMIGEEEHDKIGRIAGKKEALEELKRKIKTFGYDGIVYKNQHEGITSGSADSYILFESTQLKSVFNKGTFDPNSPNILEQGEKGAVQFLEDTRALIYLFERADVTTIMHEIGHVLRRMLSPADLKIVEQDLGITPEDGGGPESLAQSAFHGSPYKFDKFSLDHIGKGEGAQAYGWGLYFAGERQVAEFYRRELALDKARVVEDGVGVDTEASVRKVSDFVFSNSEVSKTVAKEIADTLIGGILAGDEVAFFKRFVEKSDWPQNEKDAFAKGIEFIKKFEVEITKGQTYKVDLPDDSNLLVWDAPLSEQGETGKKVIDAILKDLGGENAKGYRDIKEAFQFEQMSLDDYKKWLVSEGYGKDRNWKIENGRVDKGDGKLLSDAAVKAQFEVDKGKKVYRDFGHLYRDLSHILGSQAEVSHFFKSLGILGHKYLDGSSRGRGEGSYNYVIYDDEAVQILETYYQGQQSKEPPKGKGWTREAEEKFARWWEKYLMDGIAPSARLRPIFAKMRQWFLDIYRKIKGMKDIQIPEGTRAVFDRMVSTEEERRANVLYQMNDEYPPPAAKPVPLDAMQEYDAFRSEAARRAYAEVQKDRMKERLKVEAGWRKMGQEMYEADPITAMKRAIVSRGGFNLDKLKRDWDKDTLKELNRKIIGIIAKKGKLAPDTFAIETNLESGDAVMQALIDSPTKADFVEDYIDQQRKHYAADFELDEAELGLKLVDKEIEILNEMLAKSTKDWANVTRPGMKRSIIENTRSIPVEEAREGGDYHNLKAGFQMAAKAAREAFRAGKLEQALKDKLREADIRARHRDRVAARKEYQGIMKDFQKALNDKKVEWEFREQLLAILAPFNKKAKGIPKPKESLSEFVKRKEDDGEAILFDPSEITALASKKLHEMTMDELRTLRDVVKHIHHVGAMAKYFLGAIEKKSIQDAAVEIAQTIYDTARTITDQPHPLAEKQKTVIETLTGKYRELAFEQIKIEFLFRYLDNYQNFGPMTKYGWQPIKKSEDTELDLAESIFGKYKEKLDALDKKGWRRTKIAVSGTGFFLTKEQAALIYASTVNKDNLRHLREGFAIDRPALSDDEIRAAIGILSEEDRAFVDQVIDEVIPMAWEPVKNAHQTLTGVPPVKVEGRYMPIKFDPRFSGVIEAAEAEKAVKGTGAFKEFFPPSLEKGMTITRKTGGSKALRTDFLSVVAEHLTDAIKYGSYGVALRDVLKIVNHPLVKKAIEETLGPEAYKQIRPWLKEVVNPGVKPVTRSEVVVNHIRNNFTYFIMGWRVSTIIIQPTAIFNAVPELGFAPVMKAFGSYIKSIPFGSFESIRKTHQFIIEKSPFMGSRTQSFDRDINAAMGQFDPAGLDKANAIKQAGFYLIAQSDKLVTEPVWTAAYFKALNGEVPGIAIENAVDYADGVVRRTQSSGSPKDLAGIQRGGVWQKMLVSQFFTFFSAVHNLLWESYQKKARGGSWLDFLGAYWWVAIVPALLSAAQQERRIPKDGADLAKMTGKALALYQAGRIPILRDAANVTLGGFDYRAGALGSVLDEAGRMAKIIAKGKRDKGQRLALSALKFGGMITGLPPDQSLIAMQGALDLAAGKTKNPFRLMFREQKKD